MKDKDTFDSWMKESKDKALNLGDNFVELSVHILLDKEDDLFTAHCLEFDIVSDGRTQKENIQNIFDAMDNHVSFCLGTGKSENILNPAPREFWHTYYFESKPMSQPPPSRQLPRPIKDISFAQSYAYA